MGLGGGVERTLQRNFGSLGKYVARNGALLVSATIALLLAIGALGFGIGFITETDVFELWVEQGTRLEAEMDFYEDEWSGLRAQSIIATCAGARRACARAPRASAAGRGSGLRTRERTRAADAPPPASPCRAR